MGYKPKVFKVTVEQFYYIPDYIIAQYNGDIEQIKKEYFEDYPLHQYHASRDNNKISNVSNTLKVEDVTEDFDTKWIR